MPSSETNVFVNETDINEAESLIAGCERCAGYAVLAFDYLLDAVTGSDPDVEYVLSGPASCPRCGREITGRTLICPVITGSRLL